MAQNGYNSEELYCHKANQELIEKMREKKRSHLTLVSSSSDDEKNQTSQRHEKFAEDSGGSRFKKAA